MASIRDLHSPQRSSLAWLLWLALLLPLAQSAAIGHGYTHVGAAGGDLQDSKQSPHTTHCDLCLSAAAVTGGALASAEPDLSVPATRHALPREAADSVWLVLSALAYRSRAPPSA